jgi:hypothetical protein
VVRCFLFNNTDSAALSSLGGNLIVTKSVKRLVRQSFEPDVLGTASFKIDYHWWRLRKYVACGTSVCSIHVPRLTEALGQSSFLKQRERWWWVKRISIQAIKWIVRFAGFVSRICLSASVKILGKSCFASAKPGRLILKSDKQLQGIRER